jgi:hypothetical protein
LCTSLAGRAGDARKGQQNMKITKEDYRGFWLKAKENTSCYPAQMSFATMKAGATSDVISQLECNLTNIPLQSGFSPNRWQKFMGDDPETVRIDRSQFITDYCIVPRGL